MTLNLTAAHGHQIKIGNGASSETFAEIEGIFNGPKGPGFDPQVQEAKFHSSSSIFQKVSHVKKSPVTFSIYYDSANTQHALLLTNSRTKVRTNFQQILTDSGTEQYAYGAYIAMEYQGDVDGFNVYDVTLNIDGDITVT